MKSRLPFQIIAIAIGLSAAVISAYGLGQLRRYENTPGDQGSPAVRWPAGAQIERAGDRPTLVMMLHPQCSCSEATLAELEDVMAHTQSRFAVDLLFVKPPGAPAGFEKGALWDQAARIPGVRVTIDEEGAEASRFGIATSGHGLLFAPSGTLLFNGGITGARGHAGENAGSDSLLAILNHHPSRTAETPVFGCSLLHPAK